MEENSITSSRRIVMLKKGETVPSNANQLSESEILSIQYKRIENFTPESEVKIFKYSPHIIGSTVALSGFMINGMFRKNFRLGGLKWLMTYGPSTVLPAVLSVGVHEILIKNRILLGKEPCLSCVSLKSGIYQILMGICYPYVVSILSCLPVAREFYTLPIPAAQKGIGYLKLLRQVSPSVNTLLLLCGLNMVVGMGVSRKQLLVYTQHFNRPPPPPNASLEENIFDKEHE